MNELLRKVLLMAIVAPLAGSPPARAYSNDYVIPESGGCPLPTLQYFSGGVPMSRQWSTALPPNGDIVTLAPYASAAQLDEVEGVILQSYGVWTGVTGTTMNSITFPGALGALARTATQDACTNDEESNADGINTICFNQSSDAFTTGVLAITRTITADAPGVILGAAGPSAFAGQILDADILFRSDGQASFATPGALPTAAGAASYDLETILIHELGNVFGLDSSGVWRAIMIPFAPPIGTYTGSRPTTQQPDAPLSDDDRAGIRTLYFDPADTVDTGTISGRVLPANPFALALLPSPSPGQAVTGMFGAQVVAEDATTGAVIAATIGGWSCSEANPPTVFDGSYTISHLPVGNSYNIYAEPLDSILVPAGVAGITAGLCNPSGNPGCTTPAVNTNFGPLVRPSSP